MRARPLPSSAYLRTAASHKKVYNRRRRQLGARGSNRIAAATWATWQVCCARWPTLTITRCCDTLAKGA
eukprot:6213729-Pleurochrysis_carterae.AAC.1